MFKRLGIRLDEIIAFSCFLLLLQTFCMPFMSAKLFNNIIHVRLE